MSETRAAEFEARLAGARGATVFVRVNAGDLVITSDDGRLSRIVRLDDVEEVSLDGAHVTIALGRGASTVLACEQAPALDAALVAACCTVPELTRALRSLGSSRARVNSTGQREFFAPLLDARRRAEDAVARPEVVAAFDADRLDRALAAYLAAAVEHSADARPAARRAYAAHVEDATEPLRRALATVRATSHAAAHPPATARVTSWRVWRAALDALFHAADLCWENLDHGTSVHRTQ
ncbi:MAG: hypothetical protein B7Z72_01995 [Gemmatimonadetes bacterium 21-71-4]|nr:MAG: hypothetical protein B7Z72_01995 [Gemmatimonadetes bacterium 21-71-4]